MIPSFAPSCRMNSTELSRASRAHLEFTQRLLETVRERRAADSQPSGLALPQRRN